jgi:SOUL heme-binding protein
MLKKKYMWWSLVIVLIIAAVSWGPIVSQVEQAKYKVIKTEGNIQVREYAPMIVAEVEVSGDRDKAINQGFRLIADYIFGNNLAEHKIAMTAPVIQEKSEKIAMTAPVMQQGTGNLWKVRFVMPAQYSLATLPKPNNLEVVLKEVPQKRFVVITFSGTSREENLKIYSAQLNKYIKAQDLHVLSTEIYAFFNPPWTLPFLRRNELMVEIQK